LPHRVAAGRPAIRTHGINRSADPAKPSEESPEPQADSAAREAAKALVAAEG
jgi:hypothetical protein